MSDEPYEPFDQEARLPPPPWSPDDPALKAWEAAHGHDVRVKCYVEFGCQVIEESLEREIDRLESQNQALQERAATFKAWADDYKTQRDDALVALALIQATDCDTLKPTHHDVATQALSPTQETDEPDCARCGNERTVGGYGTDERFPCPVCRPTQETDPCGIRNDQLVCNL